MDRRIDSSKLRNIKVILLAVLTISFVVYRNFYSPLHPKCLIDSYHDFTSTLNYQLKDGVDDVIIGIGQVLMDGWIVLISIIWLVKGTVSRPVYAFGAFHMFRSLVFLNIDKFPFPKHKVWHSPGFYSLTVPYDPTSDFYYSGHTGTMTIIFLEFEAWELRYFSFFAILSLVYMMNMLTITRVHYTIDVMGGLIFACFFQKFFNRFVFYCDFVISLPYLICKKIYQKCKQKRDKKEFQNDLLDSNLTKEEFSQ